MPLGHDLEGALHIDRIQRFIDASVAAGVEGMRLLRDPLMTFEPRDGYVLIADRRARIPLLNGMIVLGSPEPGVDEIRDAREQLAAEGLPFGVQMIEGHTPASERAARELGLEEIDVAQAMDLGSASALREPPIRHVTVRPCATEADLRQMVSIMAEVFEQDEEGFAPLLRLLEPRIRDAFPVFLAWDPEHGPVATAGTFVADASAMIANVATRAAWRRRGIGSSLTAVAARAGFDRGADFAWLIASRDGLGPYRSVGFEPICTIRVFAAPSDTTGSS